MEKQAVHSLRLKGHGFGSELPLSSETDRPHRISEHLIHQTLSLGWERESMYLTEQSSEEVLLPLIFVRCKICQSCSACLSLLTLVTGNEDVVYLQTITGSLSHVKCHSVLLLFFLVCLFVFIFISRLHASNATVGESRGKMCHQVSRVSPAIEQCVILSKNHIFHGKS